MAVYENVMLTNDTIGILSRGRVLGEDAARIVLSESKICTTTSWLWKISSIYGLNLKTSRSLSRRCQGSFRTTREEVIASSRD